MGIQNQRELQPAQRQWRRRVFAATWLSYFGFYFCRKPFFITKAALGDSLGWSATQLGLLGSAYLIAYTIGQFIAAAGGTKWGARRLLLAGMGVSIIVNIGFGFSNSFIGFATLLTINGFAQATGWPGNVGVIARWFRREERGTVMGFWATNYQAGGVLANTVSAWVLGAYGFRYSYFVGALVLLLVWAFFLFNGYERPEDLGLEPIAEDEVSNGVQSADEGWTRPLLINIALVGVFYFFVKFIRYAIWSWTPYMLQRDYGLAGDEAGYLSTVFDLAGIGGVIAAGYLSDRFFRGRRARISFYFVIAMAVSCAALYLLGPRGLMLFGISVAMVGFFLYGPDALMTGAGAIEVGSVSRATLCAGIINGMGSIGSVAQELIFGPMLDTAGPDAVFKTLLGASILAALCLGVLVLRNRLGAADL
jgi:sugar phosphate permease